MLPAHRAGPRLLDQVADHIAEIINTGTPNQRKAVVEALVDRVIILVPVFRIHNLYRRTGPRPLKQRKQPRPMRFAQ